jgi:hypothetical protein
VLGLLRLWVLWRIGRVVLPLLVAVVLLGELSASIHRRPADLGAAVALADHDRDPA